MDFTLSGSVTTAGDGPPLPDGPAATAWDGPPLPLEPDAEAGAAMTWATAATPMAGAANAAAAAPGTAAAEDDPHCHWPVPPPAGRPEAPSGCKGPEDSQR